MLNLSIAMTMSAHPAAPGFEYVNYADVLGGRLEENTVYIIPIKRSALPTAVIARQIGRGDVVNVEEATKHGEFPADGVFVLTRTTFRSSYKDYYRPSINHPYVKKLQTLLRNKYGSVYIVTEEIYEMMKELFEKRGFQKKHVRLDTETARKRLEKDLHPWRAAILATVSALIPRLIDDIANGRREEIRKQLIELLAKKSDEEKGAEEIKKNRRNKYGEKDAEEIYQTIMTASEWKPEYPNRILAISLNLRCSPSPECKKNRHSNCSGTFKVRDLTLFCNCTCHRLKSP